MGVLDGKVAIVTGSARGIGRATAELLSEQGARVVVNDLDTGAAEEAASEIEGETLVFGGDLTEPGVPDELVARVVDEWGRVDILVNNAGYTLDAPVHKMTDEWFQRMLDIHTIVPFRMCRAVAPHMREPAKREREEGREVFRKIVNVSSVSGTMGNPGQANYSAGKAAVVGLTKTLAKEAAFILQRADRLEDQGVGITVNTVTPGFVATEMLDNVPEKALEKIRAQIPLRRLCRPEEVARVVHFLAADASAYITGQVWGVNGGMDM